MMLDFFQFDLIQEFYNAHSLQMLPVALASADCAVSNEYTLKIYVWRCQ